jgi:hypothetical protein
MERSTPPYINRVKAGMGVDCDGRQIEQPAISPLLPFAKSKKQALGKVFVLTLYILTRNKKTFRVFETLKVLITRYKILPYIIQPLF